MATSKFNADRLREMIVADKDAGEIRTAFDINKLTLGSYIAALVAIDGKPYKVRGMFDRLPSQKVGKTGLKVSLTTMQNLGFEENDSIQFEKNAAGEVVMKKKPKPPKAEDKKSEDQKTDAQETE